MGISPLGRRLQKSESPTWNHNLAQRLVRLFLPWLRLVGVLLLLLIKRLWFRPLLAWLLLVGVRLLLIGLLLPGLDLVGIFLLFTRIRLIQLLTHYRCSY